MAKILLVDDSKTLLKHIRAMLLRGGHDVVAVSRGRDAVKLLSQETVDLVLTDLYMPPPDGFELVDAVRALPQRPPLIVMSSNAQAYQVFRDARALGASAALHKPFSAEQLLSAIDAALGEVAPAVPVVPAEPVALGV